MASTAPPATLRPAKDGDALDVIELIGSVFGEYPHCILDVDGEMPELRAIASYFQAHEGEFWVAEQGGRLVGMCGYVMSSPTTVELRKLYVHRSQRGAGLGGRLVELVERAARARGASRIELWSDTKFETAHRFYQRRGYVKGGTRELFDKSNTDEFYFAKSLEKEESQ